MSHPRPFLEAAALAMGTGRLRVIGTGLTPPAAAAGPWDDAGNTLVTGPGRAVLFERHAATSVRLEAAGLEVTRVPGTELGSGRGGPRGLTCPVSREPVGLPDQRPAAAVGHGAGTEPPTRTDLQPGTSGPGLPIGAGV